MVIVSTRDFRTNQSRYLGLANRGESVILRSRTGSFRITPVKDDDVVTSRDLAQELKGAIKEVKEAIAANRQLESLDALLNEL